MLSVRQKHEKHATYPNASICISSVSLNWIQFDEKKENNVAKLHNLKRFRRYRECSCRFKWARYNGQRLTTQTQQENRHCDEKQGESFLSLTYYSVYRAHYSNSWYLVGKLFSAFMEIEQWDTESVLLIEINKIFVQAIVSQTEIPSFRMLNRGILTTFYVYSFAQRILEFFGC